MDKTLDELLTKIRTCQFCAGKLPHEPRPVVQAGHGARVLIIGQAPGSRVHASGVPWDDASGERLRDWTRLDRTTFYDPGRIAQMPSGFCYPGKGDGGDLPPRPECAPQWHARLRSQLPQVRLTLLVGLYAQKLYLPRGFARSMTEAVRRHDEAPEGLLPLPHPTWRSRIWMERHPWFAAEVLPVVRQKVAKALGGSGSSGVAAADGEE